MKNEVEIYEVGPRDGFQNLKEYVPLKNKLEIIDGIIRSGIKHVQITSFVSPKAIPQMSDANDVAIACKEKYPETDFTALVPNLRGAGTAWETGIRNIAYVVSLSQSHNKANINCTHEESFVELKRIFGTYPQLNICLDLATTFGCPFEGEKKPEEAVGFLKKYVELGIKEVNLCDTIGVANPAQVRKVIVAVRDAYPELKLQIHIHDTRNMGMVNTLAAIECGVKKVQSTLGGLGGCPFAPGASGNLATEDLVYMLNQMDYRTGVDFDAILEAAVQEKKLTIGGVFSGHQINIERRY